MDNKKKNVYRVISIVSFCIAAAAFVALGLLLHTYRQASDEYERLSHAVRSEPTAASEAALPSDGSPQDTEPTAPPADIPINFSLLLEENPDIIGWITVDGTVIDYPILYDTTRDLYYLNHNYQGTATAYGSIFVLGENAGDFSDFNTVIYGHDLLDGNMFSQLHSFQKPDFFDSNGEIRIYTPDSVRTYRVFAAYRRDNLDIIATNDFSTEQQRQDYLDSIYAQTDQALFDPELSVAPEDQIITLSTCTGSPAHRFVVQAVLVSCEAGVFNPSATQEP